MRKLLIKAIRVYAYCVSPFLGVNCRFEPSCSAYACQAIDRYGAAKGLYLVFSRLCRCHPFCAGGCDPVP